MIQGADVSLRRGVAGFAVLCMLAAGGCNGAPPVPVTRSDLAHTLIEFERSLANNPISQGGANAVNREFDRATLAFFSGSLAEVIRQLTDLRLKLDGPEVLPVDQVAGVLKVRIEPPVWIAGSQTKPTARITHMVEVPAPSASEPFVFRICDAAGAVKLERTFAVQTGPITRVDQAIAIDVDASQIPPGQYLLQIAPRGREFVLAGRWSVVAQSLESLRSQNESRLDSLVATAGIGLRDAIFNCRGRNGLLRDRPSEESLAEYLIDAHQLATSVDREIVQLKEGRNPYRRLAGDHWRRMQLGGGGVACRVYAPPLARGDTAVPLVLVLHGAGGDENMFMDAYGRGLIKTLAENHGFLVASPLTYPFLMNPALADELVNVLAGDYAIDLSRVYVLGHSLGGGAASRIARERPNLAAAVCCMASGDFSGATQTCPALIFAGGIDPISNARALERGARNAAAGGLAVEYRQLDDYGHTLLVDKVLADAINWLLASKPAARPATTQSSRKRG